MKKEITFTDNTRTWKVIESLQHKGNRLCWENVCYEEHKAGKAVQSAKIHPFSLGAVCFRWSPWLISISAGHQTAFRKDSDGMYSLMFLKLEKIPTTIYNLKEERYQQSGNRSQFAGTVLGCLAGGSSSCQRGDAEPASLSLGHAGFGGEHKLQTSSTSLRFGM